MVKLGTMHIYSIKYCWTSLYGYDAEDLKQINILHVPKVGVCSSYYSLSDNSINGSEVHLSGSNKEGNSTAVLAGRHQTLQ
jgi:hypothetical protein